VVTLQRLLYCHISSLGVPYITCDHSLQMASTSLLEIGNQGSSGQTLVEQSGLCWAYAMRIAMGFLLKFFSLTYAVSWTCFIAEAALSCQLASTVPASSPFAFCYWRWARLRHLSWPSP
jgi:hypothetical protein